MTRKLVLSLATMLTFAVAGTIGTVSGSAAAQKHSEAATDISAAKKGGGGGGGAKARGPGGPRNVQRSGNVGPRAVQRNGNVGRRAVQRNGNVGPRAVQRNGNVGRRAVQRNGTVGPRAVQRNGTVGPRAVQRNGTVGPRTVQRNGTVGPRSRFGNVKLRNANRARIAGRNYSVWRGSHRVRRGGHWRTFAALSTLSALMLGSSYYYPYAYIDAPAPYCEGLTEDGCQLQWREVPTLEGPPEFQCVAYCPWQ